MGGGVLMASLLHLDEADIQDDRSGQAARRGEADLDAGAGGVGFDDRERDVEVGLRADREVAEGLPLTERARYRVVGKLPARK